MRNRKRTFVTIAAALGLTATACSSPSSATPTGSNPTYTIGVLTDVTGLASSADGTTGLGAQAGVYYAKANGFNLKYIVADTQSTQVLTAAKQLVEQDHVLAVVAVAGLLQAAAPFLKANGVPVIGAAEDGTEWLTDTNMFGVFGGVDPSQVVTTPGQFFKDQGATNVAGIGYGIQAFSSEAALGASASAKYAGLETTYTNANFPFGSTNVAPIALAMKAAGTDSFDADVEPDAGLGLVTALRGDGVNLKVAVLATGYGGDLTQGGPGAIAAAQNVYFFSPFEPLEMQTPATIAFKKYLVDAGITGDPTYGEYAGYASVAMLVQALQVTGPNPSHAKLITALNGIKNFDAAGLLGTHKLDDGARVKLAYGPGNCVYMTQLKGFTFELVPGADPVCGTNIAGMTVKPSS